MTVAGDLVFEGAVVECTVADPDVQFLAQGETAEMEVGADAGGGVFVTVSGAYEFDVTGTAAFDPATAGIDTGNVTITGTGASPDDSTAAADFTVDAQIVSC